MQIISRIEIIPELEIATADDRSYAKVELLLLSRSLINIYPSPLPALRNVQLHFYVIQWLTLRLKQAIRNTRTKLLEDVKLHFVK